MSPVELSCPACNCALRASGAKPGCRIRCTRCGEVFALPAPAAETALPAEVAPEPAPVASAPPAPAPVPVSDDDVFAKIADADDPVAAAAEVRKPKPAPGDPGNPLPLDDEPPVAPPRAIPIKNRAAPKKKRRTEEWDEDETRAKAAINPLWLLGGLGVLAAGVLAFGMFVLSKQFDKKAEEAAATARRERDAADRRERESALAAPPAKPAPNDNPLPTNPAKPDPLKPEEDPEPVKPEPVKPEPMEAEPGPAFPPAEVPERPAFPPNVPPGFPPGFPPNFPPGMRPARPRPPAFNPPGFPNPGDPAAAEARPEPVRPAANPAKITATKAADRTEIKLPGAVDLTCFGGGGRYVLLRIPSAKQVAVLDVCEGKITKYVPLPEDGALIAAGNEHLFVLAPNDNIIQRWNLTTFEKERTIANPLPGPARHLLVGHATDGPLFVVGPNQALDTKTFKEVALGNGANGRGMGAMAGHPQYPPNVRLSADGRVFAWHTQGLSPSGLSAMVVGPTETKSHYEHATVGAILPGPDGTLFTAGGLFTPELKPVGEKKGYQYWYHAPIPAAHGKLYVSVASADLPNRQEGAKVSLKMVGENKALGDLSNLTGLDVPRDHNQTMAKGLQLYNRVFLVPDAKALVVLHGTADKVTIHAFDAEAVMAKSGVDFLFVTSRPTRAVCGELFTYKPEVKSRRGGVKVKLDAGPDGMKVEDGTVTWKVPENFADAEVSVILTVTDSSGQETLHTFKLPVASRP